MAIANGVVGVIGTGVVAACGTILAGLASESFKRHKELQSLARAILCEIDLTIEFISSFSVLDEALTNKAVEKITENEIWHKESFLIVEFSDPFIYKKISEKIGYFPVSAAGKVVAFYTNLISLEHRIRITYTADNLSLPARIENIQSLPKEWVTLKGFARPLMKELKAISNQRWAPVKITIDLAKKTKEWVNGAWSTMATSVRTRTAGLRRKREGS